MDQPDAVLRFLKLPELIERLVSFLNPRSTLHLLQSRVMDKETLQKSLSLKAWTQLIRRTPRNEDGPWNGPQDGLLQGEGVRELVKILEMLRLEEPSSFLLPLLDLICESASVPKVPNASQMSPDRIVMICPCHMEPHIVSTEAFKLLEEVEGTFGTALQSIKSMSNLHLEVSGDLKAITSRMSRQRETVTSVNDASLFFSIALHTPDIATLMKAEEVSFGYFIIGLDMGNRVKDVKLGEEDWEVLAAAFRNNPNVVIETTGIAREELEEAQKDIIMEIWDATTDNFEVFDDTQISNLAVYKSEHDRDSAWTRLQQIANMDEYEFNVEFAMEKYGIDITEQDEGEDDGAEEEGDTPAVEKPASAKPAAAAQKAESSSDDDSTDEEEESAPAPAKAAAKEEESSSDSSSDEETAKPAAVSAQAAAKKEESSSDEDSSEEEENSSDDDDSSDEEEEPAKPAAKKVAPAAAEKEESSDNDDDSSDEEDD